MKATIKIMMKDKSLKTPEIMENGDWIDLRAAEDIMLPVPMSHREHKVKSVPMRDVSVNNALVSLGVAMKLPKGYEAYMLPRSSTYKNFGVILGNSMGIIDNTYNGNDDVWLFNAIALKPCTIHKGDRICQFRIQLSQKATIWQKIKWLFTSGVEIEIVDALEEFNRGGIGSTGVR